MFIYNMAYEIERKFLVNDTSFVEEASHSYHLKQGYLSLDKERTVRVRIMNDKAFITIKGASTEDGLTRFEWEKEIDVDDANNLLKLALPGLIVKTRYFVPQGDYTWEIDIFEGENRGLIMAEVELEEETDEVKKPPFIGEEVTGDKRYYNTYLMQHPYLNW